MRVKLKKKKEKNLEKRLLKFTNFFSNSQTSRCGWFNLKNKKKEKKRKEKKKTFVSLPRKKQTQSSGFETVGIRQGSDITRVEITRGERRSGATKVPRFSSSFFSFGGGALKRSRGGDKPQKTTARVVAVTDYAVPQRFTVWRIKGGGKGGREKREVAG